MHCEDSEITNTNSLPCLQMTSIANQKQKKFTEKEEIQFGDSKWRPDN